MGLRQDRVADQIKDAISAQLQGGVMNDPRLQAVSITYAKVSPDLQVATIYFRCFDPAVSLDDVRASLTGSSGFFRKCLASRLKIRRVPQLRFFFDESIETASRIEALLSQI